MKVLLLNGSPRKEGCTYTALTEIAETLKKNGVEAEIFQAGDPSQENVAAAAAIMKEDRKSTRLNSSHRCTSRMPSSA